ncbi:MAG TPA: porin, partial [Candidatus Competibacteraceae bacterium]|nr:porin [Candidatus Competibacteraceae bacterium]
MRRTALSISIALSLMAGVTEVQAAGKSTLERRLADLERRIEQAETRAARAEARARQAEEKARQTDAQVQQVEEVQARQVAAPAAKPGEATKEFSFKAYARAGALFDDNFNGVSGTGPYMSPAGRLGASVGRLGVEGDKYMEAMLQMKQTLPSGAYSRYFLMIADSVESNNDWTADDSKLNVRQLYAELGN